LKHNIPNEINLTEEEITQIENWNKRHDRACPILTKNPSKYYNKHQDCFSPYGAIGGGRTYCFTPTSIGTIITVKCTCGEEFIVDNNL